MFHSKLNITHRLAETRTRTGCMTLRWSQTDKYRHLFNKMTIDYSNLNLRPVILTDRPGNYENEIRFCSFFSFCCKEIVG